ncbi:unnamed protein product, partial [Polarella glacialis]
SGASPRLPGPQPSADVGAKPRLPGPQPQQMQGPSRGHSPVSTPPLQHPQQRQQQDSFSTTDSPRLQSPGSATPDKNGPRPLPKEYRHGHVPKNVNLQEEYRQGAESVPITTLMIRNIPNRYTSLLDGAGGEDVWLEKNPISKAMDSGAGRQLPLVGQVPADVSESGPETEAHPSIPDMVFLNDGPCAVRHGQLWLFGPFAASTAAANADAMEDSPGSTLVPEPALGPSSPIWLLSSSAPQARRTLEKNIANQKCEGIKIVPDLLERCTDIWISQAGNISELNVTQEAQTTISNILKEMSMQAMLNFAATWRQNVLDIEVMAPDEFPTKEGADEILVGVLRMEASPEATGLIHSTVARPMNHRRRTVKKPVLDLLRCHSFVDTVSPINLESFNVKGSDFSDSFYNSNPSYYWSSGAISSEAESSRVNMDSAANCWRLTNILNFPYVLDTVCFNMATQLNIAELTSLAAPVVAAIKALSIAEAAEYEPASTLKGVLSYYLVRKREFALLKKNTTLANRWNAPVCLMCKSKAPAVTRQTQDLILEADDGRWMLDMTKGSPKWDFLPACSPTTDQKVDINSARETPISGLAHRPPGGDNVNIASNANNYCDLQRARGSQRPLTRAQNEKETDGVFMEFTDEDQEVYGFHLVPAGGQDRRALRLKPPRDFNEWADALTNKEFDGFNPAKGILMLLGKDQGALGP